MRPMLQAMLVNGRTGDPALSCRKLDPRVSVMQSTKERAADYATDRFDRARDPLLAELKRAGMTAIGVRPEHSKITRMSIESVKFEAGLVYFPYRAPWLADLEAELFSFPNGRHDDQVDSISQALAHSSSGFDPTLSWVG